MSKLEAKRGRSSTMEQIMSKSCAETRKAEQEKQRKGEVFILEQIEQQIRCIVESGESKMRRQANTAAQQVAAQSCSQMVDSGQWGTLQDLQTKTTSTYRGCGGDVQSAPPTSLAAAARRSSGAKCLKSAAFSKLEDNNDLSSECDAALNWQISSKLPACANDNAQDRHSETCNSSNCLPEQFEDFCINYNETDAPKELGDGGALQEARQMSALNRVCLGREAKIFGGAEERARLGLSVSPMSEQQDFEWTRRQIDELKLADCAHGETRAHSSAKSGIGSTGCGQKFACQIDAKLAIERMQLAVRECKKPALLQLNLETPGSFSSRSAANKRRHSTYLLPQLLLERATSSSEEEDDDDHHHHCGQSSIGRKSANQELARLLGGAADSGRISALSTSVSSPSALTSTPTNECTQWTRQAKGDIGNPLIRVEANNRLISSSSPCSKQKGREWEDTLQQVTSAQADTGQKQKRIGCRARIGSNPLDWLRRASGHTLAKAAGVIKQQATNGVVPQQKRHSNVEHTSATFDFFTGLCSASSGQDNRKRNDQLIPDTGFKIVVMGTSGSGKTAIIQQFLYGTFARHHQPTVEDTYFIEFPYMKSTININVSDTSGTYQFPAMKKLAIDSGDAFILVYAVDDRQSLDELEQLRQQILCEREQAYQEVAHLAKASLVCNDSGSLAAQNNAFSWSAQPAGEASATKAPTKTTKTTTTKPLSASNVQQQRQLDSCSLSQRTLAPLFMGNCNNSLQPGYCSEQLALRIGQLSAASLTSGTVAASCAHSGEQASEQASCTKRSSLGSSICSSLTSNCSSTDNSRRSSASAAAAPPELRTRRTRRPPMVIVANKCDLPKEKHQVNCDEIEALAVIDWDNGFVRASAALNWNIDEIFKQVLKQARMPPTLSEAIVSKRRKSLPPKLPLLNA